MPAEFVVMDGVVFGDVIVLIVVVKCKELLSSTGTRMRSEKSV